MRVIDTIRQHFQSFDLATTPDRLSAVYGLSESAVRKAMDQLVQDGLIERFRDRGERQFGEYRATLRYFYRRRVS